MNETEQPTQLQVPAAIQEDIKALWKRFIESRDETNNRFTGFQEYILYVKNKLGVPTTEQWDLAPDASTFTKKPPALTQSDSTVAADSTTPTE